MRIDDELIDQATRNEPAWQPPAGFAERTAARGAELLRGDIVSVPRLWSWANVSAAVPLAVLTAIVIYFAAQAFAIVAPAVASASAQAQPATWLWAIAADAVAAWFVVRSYAAD